MPVSGLPNPIIHRLCRRCGKWHHLHEGAYEFTASSGPFSWIINSYYRNADSDAAKVFICSACTRPALTPAWIKMLITLASVIVAALGACWLYSSGMVDNILQGMGH